MYSQCLSPLDYKLYEDWTAVHFIYRHIPCLEHRYLTQGRCLTHVSERKEWYIEPLFQGHSLGRQPCTLH